MSNHNFKPLYDSEKAKYKTKKESKPIIHPIILVNGLEPNLKKFKTVK